MLINDTIITALTECLLMTPLLKTLTMVTLLMTPLSLFPDRATISATIPATTHVRIV